MVNIFLQLVNMSITASYLIVAVLFVRLLCKRFPKSYSFFMWGSVGIRLLCPVSFSTVFSIFNLSVFQRASSSTGKTMNHLATANLLTSAGTNANAAEQLADQSGVMTQAIAQKGTQALAQNGLQGWIQSDVFYLTIIWLIGIFFILGYSLFSYIRLKNQVKTAVRIPQTNIYEVDSIASPFVMGIVRAKIYIPFRLPEEERRLILEHEKYHIKRKDQITKLIAFLLTTIYWFNPLVWIAYYCMSMDMEMSCDEAVLAKENSSLQSNYSASLLSFATNKRIHFPSPIAFGETGVVRRIKNIFAEKKKGVWVSGVVILLILVVSIVFLTNGKRANGIFSPEGAATEEKGGTAIAYEYSMQEVPKQYLFYAEIYKGTELVGLEEVTRGTFSEENKEGIFEIYSVPIVNNDGYMDAISMNVHTKAGSGIKTLSMPESQKYNAVSTGYLWDRTKQPQTFQVGADYIIQAAYFRGEDHTIEPIACVTWNEGGSSEKNDHLAQNECTILMHVITGDNLMLPSAILDIDGDKELEIICINTTGTGTNVFLQELHIYKKNAQGIYQDNVYTGAMEELTAQFTATIGQDGKSALLTIPGDSIEQQAEDIAAGYYITDVIIGYQNLRFFVSEGSVQCASEVQYGMNDMFSPQGNNLYVYGEVTFDGKNFAMGSYQFGTLGGTLTNIVPLQDDDAE